MLKNGEKINCQFVGISTGVKPNISFLKDSEIKTDKGILINEFFETSCKNVYAIGDCAQFEKPIASRKPLEQVWYTGRMHGETLAQTLCGNKTAYQPGPWYNSAKFFNVEYQTYGIVPAKTEKENDYFFWQHPVKNIAVGFYFSKENKTLLGINAYGMRLRHVVFDDWLRNKKSVEYILENFAKALFDAEFKKNYLPEIISSFNAKTGASVKRKKRFSFTN
jgi:NADPH-dependent 2,4-dienoyl-CoA reductase/sulfur reductase-like enzyme